MWTVPLSFPYNRCILPVWAHFHFQTHTCFAMLFLPCQHQPQIPSFFYIILYPFSILTLSVECVSRQRPLAPSSVQEMVNMPQKADGSVGLADCQHATPSCPASSSRRWGLFPHDIDPARGLDAPTLRIIHTLQK